MALDKARKPLSKNAPSGARLMATALAAGALSVITIFFVFAFFQNVVQSDIRRSEIDKYLRTISNSTAWGIDNWLAGRLTLAEDVAHCIEIASSDGDPSDCLKSPVYGRTFLWTYYGDDNGGYYSFPWDDTIPKDYDPRARPWYKAAVKAGMPTLTEPYLDITTNIETVTAAVPVRRDGQIVGVVGADFSTDSLADKLKETDLGGLGYAFIVSGDGRILAHPDRKLVSQKLSLAYPGAALRLDGSVQYVTVRKRPLIIRIVKIPGLEGIDWRLGLAIDSDKAFASVREFHTSVILATIAAVLLMIIVLGFVIHRLLVRPLMRARIAADAASAAKSEFLASMSHEIRTPMNGVLGMAEILLNSDLGDRQRELASIIVSSGQALMTVINDILDFSKLEAGKLRLAPQGFNLRQMVYEVATMMQARALEKNIELIVRYAPNLPEGIVADEMRLRQVLTNLIGNAVKFTEGGHVLIDVSGQDTGGEVNLEVSVTDTGIGIAPADIPRMFEKFEQADASHTRRFGGTGLGLAICRDIINLMDGEIDAESELGKGSRFWFKITTPVDSKIKPMAPMSVADFDDVRLLAVDDNNVNRRIIQELAQGWDMRATVVADGAGAISALEHSVLANDPYSVILMDFQMPVEDGAALTQRIQSDPRFADIPVIMLSSIDPSQASLGGHAARFAAHLSKPVRPSHLMDVLTRILSNRAADTAKRIAVAAQLASPKTIAASVPSRTKILVAEDNTVNQLVVKNMVNRDLYEVVIAENGEQAIELFIQHAPAIVLMDLSMPVMDGFEATRRIRALERDRGLARTPIIATTAHVLDEDRSRCLAAGMDDFLAKPIRKPRIEEILDRWIVRAAEDQRRCAS